MCGWVIRVFMFIKIVKVMNISEVEHHIARFMNIQAHIHLHTSIPTHPLFHTHTTLTPSFSPMPERLLGVDSLVLTGKVKVR